MAAAGEGEAYCKGVKDEPATTGTKVGRYVIDDWLASGGMSDVYRARAVGAAGVVKELVIKRVSASALASEHALARFVDEARLSMQLSHANIVTVFDFGRAEDGYYLAMEWIDGIDLAALLGRAVDPHPLPTSVVAYVGASVARALHHAHTHPETGGIVHRDVKPSNVLLSRAGEAKLSDFGIAVTRGDTRTIAGTTGYIAPEQARGEDVDARADIFGLGKILLEIAIGFRVDDEEIEARLDAIDPELAAIAGPMLAMDPAERTASAKSVASSLERLSSRAVAAGEEPPRDVLAHLVDRACASRPARIGKQKSVEAVESFALTATVHARDASSDPGGATRDIRGKDAANRGARAVAPRAERVPSSDVVTYTRDVVPDAPGAKTSVSTDSIETALPAQTRNWTRHVWTVLALGAMAGGAYAMRSRLDAASGPEPARPPSVTRVEAHARAPAPSPVPSVATEVIAPAVIDAGVVATSRLAPASTPPRHTEVRDAHERTQPVTTSVAPAAESADPARARGSLSIAARPWANVFVDGRAVGTTPVIGLSVEAGTHQIRLENDVLGVTRALSVEVPEGGRRNVSVSLP